MNGDGRIIGGWQSDYEEFYNKTLEYLYSNLNTKINRDVQVSSIANAIKKTVSSIEELTLSVSSNKLEMETMTEVVND
jgi:hypothetical protein